MTALVYLYLDIQMIQHIILFVQNNYHKTLEYFQF